MGEARLRRWRFGGCEYSEASRVLTVAGEQRSPGGRALDVLGVLLRAAPRLVSMEDLLYEVWQDKMVGDSSVTATVTKLRTALEGSGEPILVNERGRGYRIGVAVLRLKDDPVGVTALRLTIGDAMPGAAQWEAVRLLGGSADGPVWLAEERRLRVRHVFRYAATEVNLRGLRQELEVVQFLRGRLGEVGAPCALAVGCNLETAPYFLESEYGGENLREWLGTAELRERAERERLAIRVVDAVAALHGVGVVHGRLGAGSVVTERDESGFGWRVRLVDFRQGRLPEEQEGSTAQGDVAALGLLVYQILRGVAGAAMAPGWEEQVGDALLVEDLRRACAEDEGMRLRSAVELAERLHLLEERRVQRAARDLMEEELRVAEARLERARVRRPYVLATAAALVLGLFLSSTAAWQAWRERQRAEARAATTQAMFDFLAHDLLEQSNPYGKQPGGAEETLVAAVDRVASRVDERFAGELKTAAQLHETLGDSYRARTEFKKAAQEYGEAAQEYRREGRAGEPMALKVEMKRGVTLLASNELDSVPQARALYGEARPRIAGLRHPSVELLSWETLVQAGLLGLEGKGREGIPLIEARIAEAQRTQGFEDGLLDRMRGWVCGTYVALGDGPMLERCAREYLAQMTAEHGAGSERLFPALIFLAEGLYMNGRFTETIAVTTDNLSRMKKTLAPGHQSVIGTLIVRGDAEAQVGRFDEAKADELAAHEAAQDTKHGYLAMMSLRDAALFACDGGHPEEGLPMAHEVADSTMSTAGMRGTALYAQADCLLAEWERRRAAPGKTQAAEVTRLLNDVDGQAVEAVGEAGGYRSQVAMGRARLALLEGRRAEAVTAIAAASVPANSGGLMAYQKKRLGSLQDELGQGAAGR